MLLLLAWTAPGRLHAQATPAGHPLEDVDGAITPDATTNDSGPIGVVPLTPGFNASLGTTSQHDSASGWSSTLSPNLAYRFGPHFSINGGTTAYSYVTTYNIVSTKKKTKTTPATTVYGYQSHAFVLGDTLLNGTYETKLPFVDYAGTATLGLPTGNYTLGLGAGQVTYNIDNHFERDVTDWLTPEIELGIGNSENLDNQRVRKNFNAVGTLAHFQAGFNFSLPLNVNFSTDAYEDLPLAAQTVTSITSKGKKGRQITTTTGAQAGIGEDNGFVNTLDIPLNGHVTLSGIYNRSLRNHEDIAGFSLTFLLRSAPHGREKVE